MKPNHFGYLGTLPPDLWRVRLLPCLEHDLLVPCAVRRRHALSPVLRRCGRERASPLHHGARQEQGAHHGGARHRGGGVRPGAVHRGEVSWDCQTEFCNFYAGENTFLHWKKLLKFKAFFSSPSSSFHKLQIGQMSRRKCLNLCSGTSLSKTPLPRSTRKCAAWTMKRRRRKTQPSWLPPPPTLPIPLLTPLTSRHPGRSWEWSPWYWQDCT